MSAVLVVLLPMLQLSVQPPATELRKCVASTGAVSYQTLPCADASRQAWVQPIKPGSAPRTPSPKAPRRADRSSAAGASKQASPRAAPRRASATELRRQRCEKARREANDLRDRLWNKLDFQARSDLDAKVAKACSR